MVELEYDPVIDALQTKIDGLWKLTQSNMNMDMFNVMDQIRLEQIDKLKEAIQVWERHTNVLAGETLHNDKGYEVSTHDKQKEFADKRNLSRTNDRVE